MTPRVLLPLAILVFKATPKIIADAHAAVLAARDPNSPDGAKIDAAELAQIVIIIAGDIATTILPALEKALA